MSVKEVSVSSEYKKLIGDGAVVVDFSATWCGPCRRVEPVFKELAKSNKNIKFVRVDIDEASETMPNELQGISGVPTFKFFFDGKQIDTFSGANLNRLRENVDKLKKKLADSEKSNDEASSSTDAKSSSDSEEENKVAHVSTNQEFTKIISHGKVVVDFSASWCFPCKMIAPTFEELAKDNKDIKFVKIDIDEAAEELEDVLAGIIGVPTFFYYLDGEVIDRMSGANVRTLKEKLRQLSARESKKKEEKPEEKKEEKAEEKKEEKANEEEKCEEEEDQCCGGVCGKKSKQTSQDKPDEKQEEEKKTDEETGETKEEEKPAEPQTTESKEEESNEDASIERSDRQSEQKNESGSDETSEQKVEDKLEASTSEESTEQKMEQDEEPAAVESPPAKEEPAQEDKMVEEPSTTSTEEKTEEHEKSD